MAKLYVRVSQLVKLLLIVFALSLTLGKTTVSKAKSIDSTNCLYIRGVTIPSNAENQPDLWVTHFGLLDVHSSKFTELDPNSYDPPKTMVEGVTASRSRKYVSYVEFDKQREIQTIVATDTGASVELPLPSTSNIYWSPDNTQLAYYSYDPGISSKAVVVIANADGRDSKIIPLLGKIELGGYFSWSPDSAYIAVQQINEKGLYFTFVSTHDLQQRTTPTHGDIGNNFAWQPRGHQFAYQWSEINLSLINPDTAKESVFSVTDQQIVDRQIVDIEWSPNGQYVDAVSHALNATDGLYRIDLYSSDGSKVVGVGSMEFNIGFPVWSPDGGFVIFRQPVQNVLIAYHLADKSYETLASNVVGFITGTSDNQSVIMEQQQNGHIALNHLQLSNRHVTSLVENLDQVVHLYWLIDNTVLAAITKQSGSYNVDVVEMDTLNHHRLASGLSQSPYFDWGIIQLNPDEIPFWWRYASGEAAIDSYGQSGKRLYRLRADTDELDPLITGPQIVWSPEHQFGALFLSDGHGFESLQIASSDGKSSSIVRRHIPIDTNLPVWSPDSSMIAFTQITDSGGQTLEIVGRDGTDILSFRQFATYRILGWTSCSLTF